MNNTWLNLSSLCHRPGWRGVAQGLERTCCAICMLLHDFTSCFTLSHFALPLLDGMAFQHIWIAFAAFAQRSVACWWLSRHHGSCPFWHWPSSLRLLTATDSGQELLLAGLIQRHWLKDFQMKVGANVLGSRCRINMVPWLLSWSGKENGLDCKQTLSALAVTVSTAFRAKWISPINRPQRTMFNWPGQNNIQYIFKAQKVLLNHALSLFHVTKELMPNGLERSPDRSTAPMAKRIPQQLMPSATSVRCVAFRPSLVSNIVSLKGGRGCK